MKKIIIILLMTLTVFSGFSQSTDWSQKRWANGFDMTAEDSTYEVQPPVNYIWNIFVKVTDNTDTVRLVLLQGPNGDDWCGYYNTDTIYITEADRNMSFEDPLGIPAKWIGLEVITTDEATLDIWYTTRRR
jgi:hypothetical protein